MRTLSTHPLWNSRKLARDLRPDFLPNLRLPRHRWFPFKEGFSASLVSYLFRHVIRQEPGKLLDPFLGSGTSLLEGATLGWEGHGIEVNPFLSFVSRVKTEQVYDPDVLTERAKQVLSRVVRTPEFRLPRNTTLVERSGLEKWFFNGSVARRYERLRSSIDQGAHGEKYRRLLRLALIVAMGDVANAKRDGKCWRYKREWHMRRSCGADLDAAFRNHVAEYVADLKRLGSLPAKSLVRQGDSRNLASMKMGSPGARYDAVITSPPYLNSFDYTDIYRPELFLLGSVRSTEDLRRIRLKTVRSHVQVKWPTPPELAHADVMAVSSKLRNAPVWDRRLPDMVDAYFADLDQVVRALSQCVRVGGHVCFVVATSAYAGVVVPVDKILTRIFKSHRIPVIERRVLRKTLGNGHHQNRSHESLREVLLIGRVAR